jgi:ribosome-associated translation inhibitor RaiA
MQLDIAGHHTTMPPHLLSGIVERLEALNTAQAPTFRARVTLCRRTQPPRCVYQARVTLILAGRTFHAKGAGTRLDEAVATALETVAQAVHGAVATVYTQH